MQATRQLHRTGQSLWLDNITRDLLTSGTLERYIGELSITGLTSNPTIFDQAIKHGTGYDAGIRERMRTGKSGEDLFFEIALEDLTRAADLFRPIHERTQEWMDGSRSRCPRCWHMRRNPHSPRRRICMPAPAGPICSSRFPGPRA